MFDTGLFYLRGVDASRLLATVSLGTIGGFRERISIANITNPDFYAFQPFIACFVPDSDIRLVLSCAAN
jgi:hypothetical protein